MFLKERKKTEETKLAQKLKNNLTVEDKTSLQEVAMASKLFFSLQTIKPTKCNAAGTVTCVTSKEVPGFVNVSLIHLHLKKKTLLEPLWHPNANKLGYCLQGTLLVTMRTPTSVENYTVKAGEIFFIPRGFIHHFESIGELDCEAVFALDHAQPEVMHLTKAIYSISDSVFNFTFNTNSNFVEGLKKTKLEDPLISLPQIYKKMGPSTSRYKLNIEESDKPIMTKGGYLQLGTKEKLPELQGLGLLAFGLNQKGCVEPHWHTNAGELIYIVTGKTRITVLSPEGKVEVMEANSGEGVFAAASHFHNIENIGNEEVKVIAFFTDAQPDYMGIAEVMGAYSNAQLGSIFNVSPSYFDSLKKISDPLVIVPV